MDPICIKSIVEALGPRCEITTIYLEGNKLKHSEGLVAALKLMIETLPKLQSIFLGDNQLTKDTVNGIKTEINESANIKSVFISNNGLSPTDRENINKECLKINC